MESSPYTPILQHLAAVWKKETGREPELGFWELGRQQFVEDAFGDRSPQFVDQVEVNGEPWVLVLAGDKLHLTRLEDSQLRVIYVGPLDGGRYQEAIGDDIRLEFSHPRLKELQIDPLVIEGSLRSERLNAIRAALRGWAETKL